jgi:deoxycytidylate deaminase
MINQKLLDKIIFLTRNIDHSSKGSSLHFTFVVYKSKIITIGKNQCRTTHPKALEYGYRFSAIHSELDAIIKCIKLEYDISKCTFINTRMGYDGQIRIAKPCDICADLLKDFGVTKVIYTNHLGNFIFQKE